MDRESFAEAIEEHKDAVFGFACYQLGDPDDAEDVTQETFVSLWRSGGGIAAGARRSWLLRVCRNACIDIHRRRRVRRRSAAAARVATDAAWGLAAARGAADDPSSELSDLGEAARRMELTVEARELLEEAMRLPEPGRSALLLRDGYDLPYADIAQVLEMTVSNVKVTLHRTRKRLRERVTGVER